MKLVVGLGNPGRKYARTRHNVGFRVLDSLGFKFKYVKECNTDLAKVGDVLYVKPHTFMNESGKAVRAVMDYYTVAARDVLVVYDDKDLPFGTLRLRSSGRSAGHNGIKSLIQYLGTEEFARVRIGIAAPTSIPDTADFVLATFTKTEEAQLHEVLSAAQQAITGWLAHGLDKSEHKDIVI